MAQNTISDELNRLIQAKAGIKSALEEKGLTIGDSSTLDEFPGLIQEMQTGGDGNSGDTSVLIDLIERDLTSIVIPQGTTQIGDWAFHNASTLTSVNIPASVTSIKYEAFKGAGLNEINIPNTIVNLGESCFYSCKNASVINIGSGVSTLPNNCFNACNKVKNITIPANVNYLQGGCFMNCTSLESVKIEGNNVSMGGSQFSGCSNLKHVDFGNGIKNIGDQCFSSCSSLYDIVYPASVTTIGSKVLNNITTNRRITLLGLTPPPFGQNSMGSVGNPENGGNIIYVKNAAYADYAVATGYKNFVTYNQLRSIAGIEYNASTYTVQALGRDNVELYVDSSLIDSSVYTFTPGTEDSSHVVTVKSVDPSLGVLDQVSQEVFIEGEIDYTTQYFGLTAVQDASVGLTGTKEVDLKYSTDGENWTQWDYANETLNLRAGETLYFKGDNSTGFCRGSSSQARFALTTGQVRGHGNIQSLVYDDNFVNNNTIPCASCYAYMFYGCTGLTEAPELPATTLASTCYSYMFQDCTGLTKAPELPATTLATSCYSYMFYGCAGLTKAPELPATTLAISCYNGMFYGCSNLNYIKAMFTSTPNNNDNWVNGVSSTGTFVMNAATEWDPEEYRGINGIPQGWTVEKVEA